MDDFEKIYGQYMKAVYHFLLKLSKDAHTAEEITQQTFVIAFEKLDSFRGECKMSVWLCQIAKHEYYAWQRKAERYEAERPNMADRVKDDVGDIVIAKESFDEIMQAVHSLSEPYKEVFLLHAMAEMSYRDIGKLFRKGEGWSRVTYYRAKKKILEKLGGAENEM